MATQIRVDATPRVAPDVNVQSTVEGGGTKVQAGGGGEVRIAETPTVVESQPMQPAEPTPTPTASGGQQATYAAPETPARPKVQGIDAQQVARQASSRPVTHPAEPRAVAQTARGVLGQMLDPSPAVNPRLAETRSGVVPKAVADGTQPAPMETEVAEARRFADEDRPLPNESTRRDPFTADQVAAAAESDGLMGSGTTPQDERHASHAREREEARKKSVRMRQAMSRSVTKSAGSVRPGLLERAIGRTQRRKAQLSTDNAPTHRPVEQVKAIKNAISRRFGRHGVGVRIYGKMVPLPTLGFREVGVGMQEIAAVIDQNPDMLDELIRANVPADRLAGFTSTRGMLVGEVADLVNSNDVEVFTAKPPNNRSQDVQRRKLRILENEQRGIYLHPVMAAMYTADFDGDDMLVSLDPSLAANAKDPMARLVGVDGEQSLDMAFLPVSQILDGYEDGKTARDYVRDVILSRWSRHLTDANQGAFDALIDAVIGLSETASLGSDSQAAAYGEVFRAARAFADASTSRERGSDRMMASVTEAVYQGMRNLRVNNALMTIGEVVPRDTLPPAVTRDDSAMFNLIDGMVMGAVPNNFQELKVMMNGFLGNVSGKSAPFRFTADVGKMMKLDKRMRVGSEYIVDPDNVEDMKDFLEATVKFAYSKRMAVDVKVAGKSFYFSEVLRGNVVREVGFPENYENMLQFLMAFVESYNRNASIINEANLVWLSNMAIDSRSNRKTVPSINNSSNPNYADISSSFIDVYGTYSFDRIFGGKIGYEAIDPTSKRGGGTNAVERDWYRSNNGRRWIRSRYKLMSIRAFSVDNHIVMEDREKEKYTKALLSEAMSDADVADGLILALADKRTSTSSKFNTDVIGRYESRDGKRGHVKMETGSGAKTLIAMMSEELRDIQKLSNDESFDQMLHVDDAVMALNATGYEMFRELGMDSTAGFLASSYGRKLIEHANEPDVIAGIRAAMVFAWQTAPIQRIADELRKLETDPRASAARHLDLRNQAAFAMDELDAKSNVWHGIMMEMRSNPSESAFMQLRTSEGRRGAYWMAPDFWTSENGYTTLRQVIEDLDMPWPLKCDIITDVVRWQTQDVNVNNFEVAFQMEVGGDSRFSLNGGAPKASLGVYRDAESASHRYANRSQENLRKEVRKAAEHWRKVPGALANTVHRLATSPWELVHIDDGMYADVILAVRDKLYPQTEKAQKHPATNAGYSALSLQRNGGYFNDVYRMDDRTLGLQHVSQLSAADLVRVLDDPDFQLTVYDDYGSIGFLDQQTLLGIDHDADEQEVWDFLIENPRLAAMLRTSSACVTTESKNRGYLGSRLSLDETIGSYGDGGHDAMGHVKYLMRDHPVYGGLVSMLNPAHGTTTRNERSRVPMVEEAVCRELYRAAAQDREMAAGRVLANLGVTRLKLRTLLTSDYDKFLHSMGFMWNTESVGEAKAEADDIYDTLERHVASYIAEIRREMPFDPSFVNLTGEHTVPEMGIDIESVASFWDAVQELSGAKVGVSTGIEGSETYQLSYWVSHMGAKDHYANLEAIAELIEDYDDPTEFDGMWTSRGPLRVQVDEDGAVTTNVAELCRARSWAGEEVVTQVPDGFDVPDRSTDSYGNPVPSLYVAMVSKRSNGAEKFNLKAMKAGLDGTDSVTKMRDKYLVNRYQDGTSGQTLFFQVADELGAIAEEQGIEAARMELANRLMAQDREMGYHDLTLANYMCLAEPMLIENPEGGVILRSLEQLACAVRGRIGARAEEMGDQGVSAEIASILSDTSEQGVGRSMVWDARELLASMRPYGTAGEAQASMRIQSSVFRRNYDLLTEIQRNSRVTPMDASQRESLHRRIVGEKEGAGIQGVEDVWRRSSILRNYQVIGYAGASNGSSDVSNQNVGPSTAIVVGDGQVSSDQVDAICRQAWINGMTMVVSSRNVGAVPGWCVADMIPISSQGDMMIPMFDSRLNGSEARPFEARFGIFKVPFQRYVISVEDPLNVFELGDAQYKFTRTLVSRLRAHDNGNVIRSAMDLFPNVYANREYRDATFSVNLASKQVVKDLICDPETPQCTIDYGLVEGAKGFGQHVHDVNAAIRRYRERMELADDQDSVLRGIDGLAPGDIVGWADMTISLPGRLDQHVLAPIIPFMLHEKNRVPESFRAVQVGPLNNDGSQFVIDWAYDRTVFDGGFVKYFDSSGGANKGMINLSDIIENVMRLKNGMDVDAYCAAASTDSRKIGTDRRIKTMISLMAMARMEGYNFARTEGAFPNDPTMRETLSKRRIPMEIWDAYYGGFSESGITFTNDREMNAFIDHECRKIWEDGGNPSDYLATTFEDEDGNDYNEHVMWEFECMFDNSLSYEDSLLKFIHCVNPRMCPNGIDDATEETYFRLYRDGGDLGAGFDRGMLQMQVPYPMSDGRIAYVWSNVFVGMSFFGEEHSANSRPNVRGASDMLDAENTLSYEGVMQSKDKARDMAAWATAGEGRIPQDAGALGLG